MGQVAALVDIAERLSEYDVNATIYASQPWTETSDAIVALEPETGGLPAVASQAGMKYFLEVGIASDFAEDWVAFQKEKPSLSAICRRLIQYAINDA
jgi:hypothetical protein